METIKRKDGIEYTRKKKKTNYDCNLNIRIEKEKLNTFKEIAVINGENYGKVIREMIYQYILNNHK